MSQSKIKKEDNVMKRVLSPRSQANIRLRQAYQDQEIEKEKETMKNTPIMLYVKEIVKQVCETKKIMYRASGRPVGWEHEIEEWEEINKLSVIKDYAR